MYFPCVPSPFSNSSIEAAARKNTDAEFDKAEAAAERAKIAAEDSESRLTEIERVQAEASKAVDYAAASAGLAHTARETARRLRRRPEIALTVDGSGRLF